MSPNKLPLPLKQSLVFIIMGFAAIILLANGCAPITGGPKGQIPTRNMLVPFDNLLVAHYTAADHLIRELRQRGDNNGPMIAASFVNINDLTESSTFGRLASEQVASRLSQHGLKVIELKLRQDSVFIKEGRGEFILSRELKTLSNANNATLILVGTYALTEEFVFTSIRLVDPASNTLLTGFDYQLVRDDLLDSLLFKTE